MDRINKNQAEKNKQNLLGEDGIKKVKELAKKAKSCFFCTNINSGNFSTRPMAPEQIDDNGNFWFLSAGDSYKK